MNWFYFSPVLPPYCVMSNSSSQLGSRFLNDILGGCLNSEVISHYSNSVCWKIPTSFLLENFPFQHRGWDSSPLPHGERRGLLVHSPYPFFTCQPRAGLVGQPLDIFFLSLSLCAWVGAEWTLLNALRRPEWKGNPKRRGSVYWVGQKVFGCFCKALWKNPNALFGQLTTCVAESLCYTAKTNMIF